VSKFRSDYILGLIINKFLISDNRDNYKKVFSHLKESQILEKLSKFKSRYEIALYMTDINIENIEKTPFFRNDRSRLKSYSSMIKFFLTYSAFESFGELFNISDNLDKTKECYTLISETDLKYIFKKLDDKVNNVSIYLIENVNNSKLAERIKVFNGTEGNHRETIKIKQQLKTIFNSHKSLKKKDFLCLLKGMRHQIAHGKLAASYTSRRSNIHISSKEMVYIFDAFIKVLFKIMDKKINLIYKELS
jgi:hypothetical protein